ncbi:hypothetical protein C1646_814466 [Rhizophagus diaphanus]|nr:hypothetical protein C1646_814466 [Rhizophagus diaphanus] [Rhizophagus sp. MUCL 43196]
MPEIESKKQFPRNQCNSYKRKGGPQMFASSYDDIATGIDKILRDDLWKGMVIVSRCSQVSEVDRDDFIYGYQLSNPDKFWKISTPTGLNILFAGRLQVGGGLVRDRRRRLAEGVSSFIRVLLIAVNGLGWPTSTSSLSTPFLVPRYSTRWCGPKEPMLKAEEFDCVDDIENRSETTGNTVAAQSEIRQLF